MTQRWESVKHPAYLYREHWRLVRSDSRVLADVDRWDGAPWHVWINGDLRGEYLDMEAAKHHAETVVGLSSQEPS